VCLYKTGESMKHNVQLEPPALAGRKQRIEDFRQFVEAKRKDTKPKRIVALYALETGVRIQTVQGYLKLLIQAGVYAEPTWKIANGHLVTLEEYEPLMKEYIRKQEEERKRREAEANQYDF
jgi:hypothetical protein